MLGEALRDADNKKAITAQKGIRVIVAGMSHHSTSEKVNVCGCVALMTLAKDDGVAKVLCSMDDMLIIVMGCDI